MSTTLYSLARWDHTRPGRWRDLLVGADRRQTASRLLQDGVESWRAHGWLDRVDEDAEPTYNGTLWLGNVGPSGVYDYRLLAMVVEVPSAATANPGWSYDHLVFSGESTERRTS